MQERAPLAAADELDGILASSSLRIVVPPPCCHTASGMCSGPAGGNRGLTIGATEMGAAGLNQRAEQYEKQRGRRQQLSVRSSVLAGVALLLALATSVAAFLARLPSLTVGSAGTCLLLAGHPVEFASSSGLRAPLPAQ
jgi:hypothetical protein